MIALQANSAGNMRWNAGVLSKPRWSGRFARPIGGLGRLDDAAAI
jgi:hypothetical protein